MRIALGVFIVSLLVPSPLRAQDPPDPTDPDQALTRLQALPPYAMDEVLWLARCILSESNRTDEQRLVAWVVRNRVETQYRGTTYREVVLEPRQFSAFNADTERRRYLMSLNQTSRFLSWRRAVAVALEVYQAPPTARPFDLSVRHFYSPISMQDGRVPPWARQATPLDAAALGVDPQRFRFYANVDETLDPPPALARGAAPTPARSAVSSHEDRPALRTRARSRHARLSGRVARPARPTTPSARRPTSRPDHRP